MSSDYEPQQLDRESKKHKAQLLRMKLLPVLVIFCVYSFARLNAALKNEEYRSCQMENCDKTVPAGYPEEDTTGVVDSQPFQYALKNDTVKSMITPEVTMMKSTSNTSSSSPPDDLFRVQAHDHRDSKKNNTSNVTIIQDDSLPLSTNESTSGATKVNSTSGATKVNSSSILFTKEEIRKRFPEVPLWMDQFLSSQPTSTHNDTLNDPNSKFIILTCYSYKAGTYPEACGGLSDRMMRLPYYVWLAHKTGRKLLIHWLYPHPLEMFLDVAFDDFDWRVPDGFLVPEFDTYANRSWTDYRNERRIVWHEHIEKPEFVNKRVIIANTNLAKIPAEPTFLNGTSREKVFGAIFHRMFKPSAKLMKLILSQYDAHPGLIPGEYSVAHVRAKWPSGGIMLNSKRGDNQGGGLNMENEENRIKVHRIADNAAFCAQKAMPDAKFIYITSDSNEIADYLINKSPIWSNISVPLNVTGRNQTHAKVISRLDYMVEPVHLNTQGKEIERYLGIFVDLWMMITSKCFAQGLGGFGHFGSELSGNHYSCRVRHRNYGTDILPDCPRPKKAVQLNLTENV
jgi:hypothetical protein